MALAPLTSEAAESLRAYWRFYEPRRAAVDAEVRRAAMDVPVFAALMRHQEASPGAAAAQSARDHELTRAAVLEGHWTPYIENLHAQGIAYARQGIAFSAWLPLVTAFRSAVRERVVTELGQTPAEAFRVLEGLNTLLDLALTHLSEAYLEERAGALRTSEERYRQLFDSNPLPMWVFDRESLAFLAVNEAAVRKYGYSRDEFLAMTLRDIRPPSQVGALMESLTVTEDRTKPEVFTHLKKDGTEIRVDVTGHALEFGGRKARLILAHDVTERVAATERNRSLEQQLLHAQKMEAIGRLAGGIAHDFNNLLSVIAGYTGIMLQDLKAGDPMLEDLSEVKKAVDRASALTRQLLAFSRQQVMQLRSVDLNTVVQGMEAMIRRLVGEDVAVAKPSLRATGTVRADPGQLEQVLMNLVVNARDAMPEGGQLTLETADVTLDESYARTHVDVSPGPYVMLAVSDTGMGMDKATQARLFEPFFTTKGPGKGTGLGLATVFGIVRQSLGTVWVYSEPGEGSTFKVYLPRESRSEGEAPAAPRPSESLRGSEVVLLVEDEAAVRRITGEILRRKGYRVIEAQNAGEALLLAEAEPAPSFDLLLTDVVMPTMSGGQLATRLLARRPGLRVLYMSGYAPDAIVRHGVLDEKAHFIQKPAAPDELLRAVRRALDAPAVGRSPP